MYNNYYDRLGIFFITTIDEIKFAYGKLIKEHNPVCYHGHRSKLRKAETINHLNEGYEILSDPIKKDKCDLVSFPSPTQPQPQLPKSGHSRSLSLLIQKHQKMIIMMIAIVVFVPILLLSSNPIETNAQDQSKTLNSNFTSLAPLTPLAPLNPNSTYTTKNKWFDEIPESF